MSKKHEKTAVLTLIRQKNSAISLPEILRQLEFELAERTLRSWLVGWVEDGTLQRTGQKRGTQYQWNAQTTPTSFAFLAPIPPHRREAVLAQIRDHWTHTSTALEGNTLSLGDTHFILQEGLTISGKPLREHQEIIGHARAIDLLYSAVNSTIDTEWLFELHKAVQTEQVNDIYKPNGAWKVEANGTNIITPDGQQTYLEYAAPQHVEQLMQQLLSYINHFEIKNLTLKSAPETYAKVHMAFAHIHPFWDGNGRLARLVANLLLLKSGQPPLLIEQTKRREYITTLSNYQYTVGTLTNTSGLWPDEAQLQPFIKFWSAKLRNCTEINYASRKVSAKRFIIKRPLTKHYR